MIAIQKTLFGSWLETDQQTRSADTNEIINAYLDGRRDGKAEAFKELFDTLFSNS